MRPRILQMAETTMAARCSDNLGDRIVATARAWIGTPYCHQASCKHVGTDCLGLIRGVWREVVGPEPVSIGAYSADWAEATGRETLIDGIGAHFQSVPSNAAKPGDVLVFRMLQQGPARHLAILADRPLDDAEATMIHVYSGHTTCEAHLSFPWRRRLVGISRFPMPG